MLTPSVSADAPVYRQALAGRRDHPSFNIDLGRSGEGDTTPFRIIGDEGAPESTDTLLCDLLRYWREKRGNRKFPSRKDLDPLDIPRLLPNLTLVDVAPTPGHFVYRLVGTAAAEILRRDLTGLSVGGCVRREELGEVASHYDFIRTACAATYQRVRAQLLDNDYALVDRLMLPLGENGEVSKILSMIIRAPTPYGQI